MLKPIEKVDLELVLLWRNVPLEGQKQHSKHEITWEECQLWSERMQAKDRKHWYLYLNKDHEAYGMVYFTEWDEIQGTAFYGFYANPRATPGEEMRMSLEALNYAFNELAIQKLSAEVFSTNIRSLLMHKKIGFLEEGCLRKHHFDGKERIDVLRLGILASDWPQVQLLLRARISELDALAKRRPLSQSFRIVILSDTNSWINPTVMDLVMDWCEQGHFVHWGNDSKNVPPADFCFCLSFGKIVPNLIRAKFRHTLVVHESELPEGKGWSPLTYQILEGKNRVPVTLFEAAEEVDSGLIYAQRWIDFEGHELVDELREGLANTTRELCGWFINSYPESIRAAREQKGKGSFYARRRPEDSEIDPNKMIAEQFNLFRVVDNVRYPAFFQANGRRFFLRISKCEASE